MKVKDNLDFDEFLAEVGVAQMGIFLNQAEFDAIYQLYSASSFFPNNSSFEPQHYSEDSYMAIFSLIYTLKL